MAPRRGGQNKDHKNKGRFTKIVKWGVVFFVFGCVLALIYAWMQRLNFIEHQVSKILTNKGYETVFEIETLTRKRAVLRGVEAGIRSANGGNQTPFLKSEKIILDYEWREGLRGNIDKLTFEGLHIFAELDEAGKPIAPIFPQQNTSQVPLILPKDGIFVNNGHVTLKNRAGILELSLKGALRSRDNWTVDLSFVSGRVSTGTVLVEPQGDVSIEAKETVLSIEPNLTFIRIETPNVNVKEAQLNGTAQVDFLDNNIFGNDVSSNESVGNDIHIHSDIDFNFKNLQILDFAFETGKLGWDGDVKLARGQVGGEYSLSQILGKWDVLVNSLSVSDTQRRTDLADFLTLKRALSKIPMVRNFSDIPNTALLRLLSSARVTGRGDMRYTQAGYRIGFDVPFLLESTLDALELSPVLERKALTFDRATQRLQAEIGLSLRGPSGLSLTNMSILAQSKNGLRLEAIQNISTKLDLAQTWTAKTRAGRPARLGAFSADLKYIAREAERQIILTGPIEYDGDVPGGYVVGLNLNGRTHIRSKTGRVETRFMPSTGTEVTLSEFENPTDWRGKNVKLQISKDGALYVLKRDVGRLKTELISFTADIVEMSEPRHLGVEVENLAIVGTLSNDLQNWRMQAMNSAIMSSDIPMGGFKTFTPYADIVFKLRPNLSPEFIIKSQSTRVKTDTVTATDMTLEIKGIPSAFDMHYSDGVVKFSTEDLPELPFAGRVQYSAGIESDASRKPIWTGTAQTFLPKAEATPIRVSYTYSEGRGSADVIIDELTFKPGKLQPQTYVQALKGKVSQVDGTVSAKLKLEFSPNTPLKSSGSASLKNLGMGTLTGPFSGINADLNFSSMFPLQSVGRQRVTAASFDPGFPLDKGVFEFEIIPDGIRLYSAVWPVGEGIISIDPTDWRYSAEQNKVTMRLENISVQDFTDSIGNNSFRATGVLEGVLPVVIEGVKTEVVGGVLRVKDGGIIKFQTPQTEAAASKNELAATAFEALKEFEYKKLEAYLDGPLDGNLIIKMEFDGKNKDVLGGAVFAWDVRVEGELINIARSFSPENMNQIYKNIALDSLKQTEDTHD